VEAVTRDRAASDEVFRHLQRFYSDREIVEITLVNAIEHFYNLVNGPLGIESDGFCAVTPRGVEDPLERAAG
jgi:alkylhydroperoxidase family enzyme